MTWWPVTWPTVLLDPDTGVTHAFPATPGPSYNLTFCRLDGSDFEPLGLFGAGSLVRCPRCLRSCQAVAQ